MFNLRCFNDLSSQRFNTEGIITNTSDEQENVERNVEKFFQSAKKNAAFIPNIPKLLKWEHSQYLRQCLSHLPSSYSSLDASRAWLCYWILNSLSLLNTYIDDDLKSAICKFLAKCQNPGGGFGGGPSQMSHLASTYAAILALCIIGTEEAYNVINREALQRFLWRLRSPEGSFAMHEGGELDVRGVYCSLVVATLTNIYSEELFAGSAEWIVGCQTYEGGFSGIPGMEAHGGYTFCGLAALEILRKSHLCDLKSLMRWAAFRQMRLEGGFQGRTNKLVDNCYSFWQGSLFVMINSILTRNNPNHVPNLLMNQDALQEYILICCQHASGGLYDKPGKPRDVYHTCYGLSGLSMAQFPKANNPEIPFIIGANNNSSDSDNTAYASSNSVPTASPYFSMIDEVTYNAIRYFTSLPRVYLQRENKSSSSSRESSLSHTDKTSTSSTSNCELH